VDEKTGTQLQVIAEVARVAAGESLTVALRGGWALEFLVGHVSRPHVDVDFVPLGLTTRTDWSTR
jgi:Aminoglycoside-2''-adenylyltransferase